MGSSAEAGSAGPLLARLRAFCLPGGEAAARAVRGIRSTQRGMFRSAPAARWVPFTAEEFVDATRTGFCWDARIGRGPLASVRVTDAYEQGRGRLLVRKGPIQLKKLSGPDMDRGEIQRYLGYVGYCPSLLVNHPTLEWSEAGPLSLRVRDRLDPTRSEVEIDLDADGRPVAVRAERPMLVGSKVVPTPWSASGTEWREWEGLRVHGRMEGSWRGGSGPFTYIQMELTSLEVVR